MTHLSIMLNTYWAPLLRGEIDFNEKCPRTVEIIHMYERPIKMTRTSSKLMMDEVES